jgi:hypothetical protein
MVTAAGPGGQVELSPEYRGALRAPRIIGPFVAAAIVGTAVLMVLKPS